MRKLIVLEHITLDGVIQSPGGPEEDPSDGFAYGGWPAGHSDEILGKALHKKMKQPFDLLLGRKTFDIWAPYWPEHRDIWPEVNTATKYVASNTLTTTAWQPTVILSGDVTKQVVKIKQQDGPDLNVWGSANLIQTLLKHDLVDTFWLMIYPVVLGKGKRLFAYGTIPTTFHVTESIVTPSGVMIMNFERAGAINNRIF